mgnify:CR=1 FL=1
MRPDALPRSATGLPPHDLAAEEAVLAALLLDNDAMNACVTAHLEPGDFFREASGWVYEAAAGIAERGDTITIPTVAAELLAAGRLDVAGGEPYLAEIAGRYFTAVGVEAHIRAVQRCAYYRRLIAAASQIAQVAYEGGPDPRKVRAHADGLLSALKPPDNKPILVHMGGNYADPVTGPAWGVPVLDRFTNGMTGGDMTIVGGHTGTGKSMAAGQIARSAASRGNHVAVFTFEMSARQYEERMASAMSGVRLWRRREDEELDRLAEAHMEIATWPLWCAEQSRMTVREIAAACRAAVVERGPLDLVVVDYLQLVQLPQTRESEATKIGQVSTALKALARELDCHMLVVSQFNRGLSGEMRGRDSAKQECIVSGEKFPVPFAEGLKGSSSIEQDADLILAIQRHGACPPDGHRRHAEMIILKNRNGPIGSCIALEDFSRCRFDWLTQEEITHAARGDTGLYRALMEDQNMYEGGPE